MLAQLPNGYRPDSFGNPGYWINNRLLYTTIIYLNPQDPPTSFFVPSFDEVLDPFTGQWKKEIMQGPTGLTASKTVGFSGDLTRALYDIDSGVELRSLPDQGIKWSDPRRSAAHGFKIRWTPDSSHVAFFDPYSASGNPAIFLLDREGKKERTIFNYSEFGETINNLYWSTDSRYIAIIGESDLFHELFVYDTLHEKYTLRCSIDEEDNLGISGLFWSPDNAYIAYSPARGSLHVISLKTGQVTKLIDNAAIAGWSKFSPFKIP